MSDRPDNLIEIENLEVVFTAKKQLKGQPGVIRAIDGVSLAIRRGEILAVAGESGCGKTTLGKAILQVVPIKRGSVRYEGIDLTGLPKGEMIKLRQKMQMIFQDPYEALNPRQNVFQTLEEPLLIHQKKLAKTAKAEKIYRYMEAVGLRPVSTLVERYPHHLSGGQRQRLAIAATMILEPNFVVADEPVSMLDVSIRAEILKLMFDLQKGNDLTYLFITHDLSLAWMIADRTAVFYLGKLVELGPAEAVVHQCRHPYSQALVSVIPKVKPIVGVAAGRILTGETPSPIQIPPGCRFHPRCWRYAEKNCPAICREEEPWLKEVGDDHSAACHFASDGDV